MSPNRTNPKSLVEEKKEIYPNLNIFHNKSIRLWIKKCPNLGPCCDDQIFELHNRQLLSSHSSVWLTSFGAKSRVFWVSVIPPSHWENYISICFQIEWDMIMVTVFLSISNQMKFHLVKNWKQNCHHDHIPFNLKGNRNIVFSVQRYFDAS